MPETPNASPDLVPLVVDALLPAYRHHNLAAIQGLNAAAGLLELGSSEFLFLRHGQTDGNLRRVFQNGEIPLNEQGLDQAQRAAGILKRHPPARIIASPMRRATQTAESVARATGAALGFDERLKERWFGDLIGTSSVDLDWGFDPPNGEALADFVHRVRHLAGEALHQPATGRPTLLVAHGGVFYVLAFALGIRVEQGFVENATPLRFTRPGGAGWRIEALAAGPGTGLGAAGM